MNGPPPSCRVAVLTLAIAALGSTLRAQEDPNLVPPGMQVLTQGPVHEAFAEPVIFDPKPGPVFPKPPPQPIEEMPPDQRPEGANVQWIPGYWAWDDTRNDYVWISGIWRDIPPGRQWVPGYWNQVGEGFQWTPGAWVPVDQGPAQYLPPPPPSLEVGPNSPPPSPDATWSPGCWTWQDSRYVWRPGFWVPFQPNWVWVPAHYVWSPGGYLYVDGYWDRPLLSRGLAFAPVYFQQPIYSRPNFQYTPTVGLVASALASSLFVRPAYHQYYFGDYYAASNFNSGIYPWYSFHQSRYGYDPLFSHYAAVNTRRDPQWINGLHDEYRYRRDHPEARPARTFVQQQSTINNVNVENTRNITRVRNLVVARPIGQLATRADGGVARGGGGQGAAMRFEQIDEARRRSLLQQSTQLQQFRQQRLQQERAGARRIEAGAPAGNQNQVRRLELPRSPVVGAPLNLPGGANAAGGRFHNGSPPPPPVHPRVDLNTRPPAAGQQQQFRHEPHLDQLPAHLRGGQLGPQQKGVLPRGEFPPRRDGREEPRKNQR